MTDRLRPRQDYTPMEWVRAVRIASRVNGPWTDRAAADSSAVRALFEPVPEPEPTDLQDFVAPHEPIASVTFTAEPAEWPAAPSQPPAERSEDDFLRRNRADRSPLTMALYRATLMVDGLPASLECTAAVNALGEVRELAHDLLDARDQVVSRAEQAEAALKDASEQCAKEQEDNLTLRSIGARLQNELAEERERCAKLEATLGRIAAAMTAPDGETSTYLSSRRPPSDRDPHPPQHDSVSSL